MAEQERQVHRDAAYCLHLQIKEAARQEREEQRARFVQQTRDVVNTTEKGNFMTPSRFHTKPRAGPFAGCDVFTNRSGEGIFTRRADGSHRQHVGTSQTPVFKSNTHLASWLRRHYLTRAAIGM